MNIKLKPVILRISEEGKSKVQEAIKTDSPSVIVIQGMPATGKTTFLNNVHQFMDQRGIPNSVIHSDNYIEDFSALMSKDKTYRVGVLDIFKRRNLFFNSKAKCDRPHGKVVQGIITSDTPNVSTVPYEIKAKKENGQLVFNAKSVLKQLKRARKEKFDYLNLSIAFPHDYNVSGKAFNPEELHHPQIVSGLRQEMPKSVSNIVDEIEAIVNDGTEVYISSGNSRGQFNMLSLARGTHTVGGFDKKANMPTPYFTNNSLVQRYVGLPYMFTRANSKKFGVSLDLSGLSKRELRKKVATKKDYELLQEAVNNSKVKPDIVSIQYQIPFMLPVAQRNKIYEIEKLSKIYGEDILENFNRVENATHTDISMRQFFDMKTKGEKHVISTRKTHDYRYCISGTSFAPPQAISEDIKLNEFARGEVLRDSELYSRLVQYMQR